MVVLSFATRLFPGFGLVVLSLAECDAAICKYCACDTAISKYSASVTQLSPSTVRTNTIEQTTQSSLLDRPCMSRYRMLSASRTSGLRNKGGTLSQSVRILFGLFGAHILWSLVQPRTVSNPLKHGNEPDPTQPTLQSGVPPSPLPTCSAPPGPQHPCPARPSRTRSWRMRVGPIVCGSQSATAATPRFQSAIAAPLLHTTHARAARLALPPGAPSPYWPLPPSPSPSPSPSLSPSLPASPSAPGGEPGVDRASEHKLFRRRAVRPVAACTSSAAPPSLPCEPCLLCTQRVRRGVH